MRLALVDGNRRAASPNLSGQCPGCGSALKPRCGALRAWHWAHRGKLHCDRWWERETDWHIGWKNKFPADWQEIVRQADNGDRHIADVMTPHNCAIEFQHSPLAPEERHARESFYGSMVWVVDGLARKRDLHSFDKTRFRLHPMVFSGRESECALLRDWLGRPVDVFFDFGARDEDKMKFGGPILWHLHPNPERQVILTPVLVAAFVGALHEAVPFLRLRIKRVAKPAPLAGFQQYLLRRERSRRRF